MTSQVSGDAIDEAEIEGDLRANYEDEQRHSDQAFALDYRINFRRGFDMAMTPTVAAARKRRKFQARVSTFAMLAVIVALLVLISWGEYQYFDFAEPWVRIVGILLAWIGAGGVFVLAIGCANKRPPRADDHS
ncbi:hypothetical protein [Burkholderia sp. MBR-1]|uniref:hypothetical protein n=1 Tax=Burkholderia sp. MBR-1 TaxID=2732364 RepID=UPI0015EEF74E|nr:hypothetical protein [Burkholderia sp. MBR-1]QMI49813.1 hypothetical protein MBR110_30555 [Burkholderia sp. MBR-1]